MNALFETLIHIFILFLTCAIFICVKVVTEAGREFVGIAVSADAVSDRMQNVASAASRLSGETVKSVNFNG